MSRFYSIPKSLGASPCAVLVQPILLNDEAAEFNRARLAMQEAEVAKLSPFQRQVYTVLLAVGAGQAEAVAVAITALPAEVLGLP